MNALIGLRTVSSALTRPVTVLVTAVAVAVTVVVVLAERTPGLIADPGPVVPVLHPGVSVVGDLAAAVTVGTLVLLAVVLPLGSRAAASARRLAVVASVVWTLAAFTQIATAYAVAAGASLDDPAFSAGLELFVTQIELGRYLVAGALLAAATASTLILALDRAGIAWATLLGFAALVPPALSGHAGSAADHMTATSSLGLHLVGVVVWVGGLVGLVVVAAAVAGAPPPEREPAGAGGATAAPPDDLAVIARRYSGLALVASLLVVVSGVLNASTRVGSPADLDTRYGVLLLAKGAASAVLLGAGAAHRWWSMRRLASGRPGAFRGLVAGEIVVMAAVMGVAVALSTSAPPVSDAEAPERWSAAEILANDTVPAAPDLLSWVTGWRVDVLWLVLGLAAAAGYLAGVHRMRRRGDGWPALRTVSFLLGVALLIWVTSGGPAEYGWWAFSTHMVQHMLLLTVVPPFLVLGAPLLLALRTLQPRRDGSAGAREWLLAVVHSRWSRAVTHPVVAAALYVVGMPAFYYSPLFSFAMRTHLGHELMILHFLLSGYLFAWVLIGADPGTRRVPYPFRLVLLLATVAGHALFGVALMTGEKLLAPEYWTVVADGRPWGLAPLADQQEGAAIAWALGEGPMLLLVVALAVLWSRDDAREARRRDRADDRDGDARLAAYNAYLARLGEADSRQAARPAAQGTPVPGVATEEIG